MSVLFYSARPIGGREGKLISREFKCLETQSQEIDYLSPNKTDAVIGNLEEYSNLSVRKVLNLYHEYFSNRVKTMDSWDQVYEDIDVTPLKDYSAIYLMGSVDLHNSNLTREGNRVSVFPYDRGQLKWFSTGIHLTNILALLKCHNEYKIPLHEYAFDPCELSVSLFHSDFTPRGEYHLYHGHAISEYNMKRLDCHQYFLSKIKSVKFSVEKTEDFVFGYTVLKSSKRERFVPIVSNVAERFSRSHIFTKNYMTGENSLIDPDLYQDFLSRSRYTYILPAYEKNTFSISRLIDALWNDCLPIIDKACPTKDVEDCFDVCLLPLIELNHDSEDYRRDLLNYYKPKFLNYKYGFAEGN